MKKNSYFLFLFTVCNFAIAQTQIGNDIGGELADDRSGSSVSLSGDGLTLAIGAYNNSEFGNSSGQVRVYRNISGSWMQLGSDLNGNSALDSFGTSVSLSYDGNRFAIGAPLENGSGTFSGQTKIYENIAGNWIQMGTNINGESPSDQFGTKVCFSSDGNTIAISAVENDGSGSNSGHVRIYKYITGNWTQIGSDIDGENVDDYLGAGISLSADGNIIAIGIPFNDVNGSESGQVKVYQNNAGSWTQIGNSINGLLAGNRFGYEVSLSGNGMILAIGGPGTDENGLSSGQTTVFEFTSGNWVQLGSNINGEAPIDQSGGSISLSADGTILAIGAEANDGNGGSSGHTRIYKYITGNWIQLGIDIDGEANGDGSGKSISLSADGSTLAIGSPYSNENGIMSGQVRVYSLSSLLSLNTFSLESNIKIYPNPVKQKLFIALEGGLNLQEVNFFSTLGQLVKTEKTTTIDVNSLSKGIYFVQIITDKGTETNKVIVE